MKRTPMSARTTPMARGKGLARNRKRSAAALDQDFGEEAKTVRALPCLVAGCLACPSEPAHVKSRGAGGGRFDIVPLCHAHHREQHSRGIRTFSKVYGLDLRAEADRIALEHSEPLGIRGLAQVWLVGRSAALAGMGEHSEGVTEAALLDWAFQCDEFGGSSLVAWVRRTMARADVMPEFERTHQMLAVAEALRIDYPSGSALCDAAGCPS
jgi:hypothetical protein